MKKNGDGSNTSEKNVKRPHFGIFSDVHSNLEALSVVLEHLEHNGVNSYLCCGDIVGYGPNPNECVEKVRSIKDCFVVMGNHDAASCGLKDTAWFNKYARATLHWTENVLKEENRDYLYRLPRMITGDNYTIVHGSPRDPLNEYLLEEKQFLENLGYFGTQVCFIGHSHIPFVVLSQSSKGGIEIKRLRENETIKLLPENRYIINVGSVGQPRDKDPRACCAVFNSEETEFNFFRLEYEINKTQEKMHEAKLLWKRYQT